jgi:peroxisomal 2,4-dienoyl-CoA reductase
VIYAKNKLSVVADGANAIIVGRRLNVVTESAAALTRNTGRTCVGIQVDVRDAESVSRAVKEGVAKFGRLDFVINGSSTL